MRPFLSKLSKKMEKISRLAVCGRCSGQHITRLIQAVASLVHVMNFDFQTVIKD
jgi:hypothetical protein